MTARRNEFWLLAVAGGAAAMLLALSATVSTDAWAQWFHHPARQPLPDVTVQGAQLWRIMLAVCAVVIVVVAVALMRMMRTATPETASSRKTNLWMVVGLLLIAAAARATRITESLWYDEIASWLSYGHDVDRAGAIIGNYFDPVNHVAHTLLSWISVQWFGEVLSAEIVLRLPAFVFSLISVVAVAGLAQRAVNARVGVLAGFIMAIAPVSVLEGAEARGYSMMIAFSALATWCLIESGQRKNPWLWLAYSVCCALGIWSHFVTVFIPIGHAAWLAWRAGWHYEWRAAFTAFIALSLGAVITITLYAPMIPDLLQAREMFFSSRGDEPTVLGSEGQHLLLQLGGAWYWWAAVPGLILFAIALVTCRRFRIPEVVPFTLLALPLMILVVIISGSWIYARFTFFALPGAVILIAAGIDVLWTRRRAVGLLALLLFIAVSIADLRVRPPKQPLREAADYIRANRAPEDRLIVIGLAHEVLRIYADDLNLRYSLWHGDDVGANLADEPAEWIVIEYPNSVDQAKYNQLHVAGFSQVAHFRGWVDWTNGDVLVLRRKHSGKETAR